MHKMSNPVSSGDNMYELSNPISWEKKKKIISIYRLLKILPRVLGVNNYYWSVRALTLIMLWANSADDILMIFVLLFLRKWDLTFHANFLLSNF